MKFKITIGSFFVSLILLLPVVCLAARQVSGSVPKVTPLQPPAVNISPNISHNIQYSDPSHEGEFDASGNVVSITQNQQQSSQPTQALANLSSPVASVSGPKWYTWVLWILVILFVLSVVLWTFKNEKKP